MLKLKVNVSDVAGELRLTRDELMECRRTAAGRVSALVQRHFVSKGGSFYPSASEKVRVIAGSKHMIVGVYQRGIALRYFGGTVTPKDGHKTLAIPTIHNPDPGKYPRTYPSGSLHLIPRKGKPPLLFEPDSNENKLTQKGKLRKGATLGPNGRVLFTLVPKTEHSPDPTVLPTKQAMLAEAKAGIISSYNRNH